MFGRGGKVREQDGPSVDVEGAGDDTARGDDAGAPAAVVLDLGALRVPLVEGVELAFQTGPDGGEIVGIVASVQRSRMDLMAFAAPKSHGLWDEIKEATTSAANGQVTSVDGPRGPELRLRAKIGGKVRPVRLIGIDGPRWFLRAALTGPAATEPDAAEAQLLDTMLRNLVVVRGEEAMPPRSPLPLRLPVELTAAVPAEDRTEPTGTGAGAQARASFEVVTAPAGVLGRNLTTWA
jgi:Protein of unknown function (DUF3710)